MEELPNNLTFSNPRSKAEFDDWPNGRLRCKCVFEVETTNKGQRIKRTTTNKHGNWNKPKVTTYSLRARIVDGSDEKTYLLQKSQFSSICIGLSNCQHILAYIHDTHPRYKELLELLSSNGD